MQGRLSTGRPHLLDSYNGVDPQYGEVLGPVQLRSPQLNSDFQDLTGLPPRKRIHHMIPGYDVMSNPALQAQNMTLQP